MTRRWSTSTTDACPADVTDVRAFERWWKETSATQPDLLTMTRAALLDDDEPVVEPVETAYPAEWVARAISGSGSRYRFEPGADDDGVTVEMPAGAAAAASTTTAFSWLVPGLREELVTALLKSLPKAIRKNVVPAADWARRLLPLLVEERADGDASRNRPRRRSSVARPTPPPPRTTSTSPASRRTCA